MHSHAFSDSTLVIHEIVAEDKLCVSQLFKEQMALRCYWSFIHNLHDSLLNNYHNRGMDDCTCYPFIMGKNILNMGTILKTSKRETFD